MREYRNLAVLVLACALSACGTTPPQANKPPLFSDQAYWTNPFWQAELFSAVQSVVHLPANAASPAKPGIHGTVKFLFANGKIEDPEIVASTGNPDLDKLMLQQVVTAKVPKLYGLHTGQPHAFQLPLQMFTLYRSFQYNLYKAIQSKSEYSRVAILNDEMGSVTVDFYYLDGKASNVAVAKSSGHKDLDELAIGAMTSTTLPSPPQGYAGKTLHMKVIFCYEINNAIKCPTGNNVINIVGTRILRRSVVTY